MTIVPTSTVRAVGVCGDVGWTNYFDGYYSTDQVRSSKATIRDRPIFLCNENAGATSAATAWAMVAGAGGLQYAQAGYIKFAGSANPQAFTEYNDGTSIWDASHWWRTTYAGIWSNGAQHSYVVDYNATTGKLYMQIDGLTKASTPWSPDLVWNTPWSAQFFGETMDRGDDVPGTPGARTDFSSVAVRHCAGCIWQAPTGNSLLSDWPYYKFAWTLNPTAFQIYTQR
ncbi:MAG TPA: hypothetical protein VLS28_07215 [Candidatus Sulfomarinibacteraceae bacterium]|nr:hypothetical protein [Candidatus Sulfomarinibacteraceae bacterium]